MIEQDVARGPTWKRKEKAGDNPKTSVTLQRVGTSQEEHSRRSF